MQIDFGPIDVDTIHSDPMLLDPIDLGRMILGPDAFGPDRFGPEGPKSGEGGATVSSDGFGIWQAIHSLGSNPAAQPPGAQSRGPNMWKDGAQISRTTDEMI